MKKKNKNKAKKSITAVGAVVAAGLTPGIVTGTPAPQAPSTDVELTAADVVTIDGDVFDFDELFAMRQVVRDRDQQKVVYGPPPAEVQRQEAEREAMRAKARKDSIRRAKEEFKLVYGPPPVPDESIKQELVRSEVANMDKEKAIEEIQGRLIFFIHAIGDPKYSLNDIKPDSQLIRDLNFNPKRLEQVLEELESNYGVQLTEDMLKQLNTPRRLARFIIEVITPVKE